MRLNSIISDKNKMKFINRQKSNKPFKKILFCLDLNFYGRLIQYPTITLTASFEFSKSKTFKQHMYIYTNGNDLTGLQRHFWRGQLNYITQFFFWGGGIFKGEQLYPVSYPVKENNIGSAVSDILRQTDKQTDILLLYHKDNQSYLHKVR